MGFAKINKPDEDEIRETPPNGTEEREASFEARALIERIEEQAKTIQSLTEQVKIFGAERDEALKFDAANAELREEIEKLKHENRTLQGRLKASEDDHAALMGSFQALNADIESRRAEFDTVIKEFKQFSDLPAVLANVRKEIEEETKARRENNIEKKKTRTEEIIGNVAGGVFLAGFAFIFSFLGMRYGLPSAINTTSENVQRILYNQVYMTEWGQAPLKFFMNAQDADKIIENQLRYETAQERAAAREAQQAEENGQ